MALNFIFKSLWQNIQFSSKKKFDTIKTSGLLEHLSIPNQHWEEISMDFIIGLPMFEWKSVIIVVVDRITKYAHFWHKT